MSPVTVDLEAMARPSLVVISPNHGGIRPRTVGVILHSTRGGSDDGNDYQRTINWFANPAAGVSAHRVIGHKAKEHCQCVADDAKAWHAGTPANDETLSIEFAQETPRTPYTEYQIETGAAVVAAWFRRYGLQANRETIKGHDEIPQGILQGKTDPGGLFPMAAFIARVQVLMGVL